MNKLVCRVMGHEIVKRGEEEMVRVKLASPDGLRATFIVQTEDADLYPRGCEASLGFSIQQSLPLTNGGELAAPPRRGRTKASTTERSVEANAPF